MSTVMTQIIAEKDVEEVANQIQRHRETNWKDLDIDLKAFSYAYLESYNHRRAAEKIGVNPDKGISYIRNPIVTAFINHLQDQMGMSNIITEDFVRQQWLQLLPKLAGEEEIPILDKDGIQGTAKVFHAGALVSALKELSRSTKFYENGSGFSGGVNISLNLGSVMSEGSTVTEKDIRNAVIEHRTD